MLLRFVVELPEERIRCATRVGRHRAEVKSGRIVCVRGIRPVVRVQVKGERHALSGEKGRRAGGNRTLWHTGGPSAIRQIASVWSGARHTELTHADARDRERASPADGAA